jgi:preprotein translocase subunit SecA
MMDRIEDETIRFLYFLQPVQGEAPEVPMMSDEWPDEEEGEDGSSAPRRAEPPVEDKKAAQAVFIDLTRNIQRQKDQEMKNLLTVSGGSDTKAAEGPVIRGDKVGRNDPCPCGSGKKYKKCHGSGI